MQCFKAESSVTNKISALKPNVYQCRCGPSPQCRLRELIWTCQCIPEGVSTITHIFSCHFVATPSCLLEICLLARFYSPNYFAHTNNIAWQRKVKKYTYSVYYWLYSMSFWSMLYFFSYSTLVVYIYIVGSIYITQLDDWKPTNSWFSTIAKLGMCVQIHEQIPVDLCQRLSWLEFTPSDSKTWRLVVFLNWSLYQQQDMSSN